MAVANSMVEVTAPIIDSNTIGSCTPVWTVFIRTPSVRSGWEPIT